MLIASETPFSFLLWFHRCEISKVNIGSCLFLVHPSSWKKLIFYYLSIIRSETWTEENNAKLWFSEFSFFGKIDWSHTNSEELVRSRYPNWTSSLTFFLLSLREWARKKEVSVKNIHSELGALVLVICNITFTHANTGRIIRHLLSAFPSVTYSAKYKIIIKEAWS